MLTSLQIEEQIKLLQEQKEKILSRSIEEAVKEQYTSGFKKSISPKVNNYKTLIKVAKHRAYIDAVFEVLLRKHIGSDNTDSIMYFLRLSAKKNDFQRMSSAYAKFRDNLEMRQLIKFCSAVYRYKLSEDSSSRFIGNVSNYKSEMKYASSCEECGAIAFDIAIQMKKLNFI